MSELVAQGYAEFLAQLKAQIRQRQYQALRAVNHELVGLYWELGESINRKQHELGWGKSVLENLATCKPSSLGATGFQPATCGIRLISTAPSLSGQNCNRWLQK